MFMEHEDVYVFHTVQLYVMNEILIAQICIMKYRPIRFQEHYIASSAISGGLPRA